MLLFIYKGLNSGAYRKRGIVCLDMVMVLIIQIGL
jgi:hypothetical protein